MDKVVIRFEVKKIIYRNVKTGYTLANIKILEHPNNIKVPTAEPIISGYFNAIHVKDEFKADGRWVDTGKNGYRFEIKTSSLVFPETEKGMIEFIMRFAKGVGKVSAKKIVEEFKEETFDVILNSPSELLKIEGITEKKKDAIYESIGNHKSYEDVVLFLSPLGLTHLDILDIYTELGTATIRLITENPYILYQFKNLSFKRIDELAKKLGFESNNPERIKVGILVFIEEQVKNRGDLFVYENYIIEGLEKYLYIHGAFGDNYNISKDEIKLMLNSLILDRVLVSEIDRKGRKLIYLTFYKIIEDKIVEELRDMIKVESGMIATKEETNNHIKTYELHTGLKLARKQKEAIHMVMENRFSILSGGPGTGKTQTINAIISCFKANRPYAQISLAAPTGKAAKRMTELTGMEAQTIHRLIGLKGFGEEVELKEINADFLIIDESSMIDAYVFYSLLSVVPETTRILLVGDYQQLPSVGPGLILRDLIDSGEINTTILTEIFRQKEGSQIIDNSYKVINGDNNLSLDDRKGDFYFIKETSVKKISDLIIGSINRLLKTGYKMDEIQVLSPMNKGDLGVMELNRRIQETFNPQNKNKAEVEIGGQRYFRVRDKVMQTENNYDLEVFNGEVGRIEWINKTTEGIEVLVDFGDKDIIYTNDNLHELVLAYAITIHKSQGSEFDAVIMPIHESLSILLNRNVIYTGITRAKKRVVLIGDKSEFDKGIERTDNTIRNSQIKERISVGNKSVFSSDNVV